MGHAPDAATALAAVTALHVHVATAYHGGSSPTPADAPDWARLVGQLTCLDKQVRWMRDAALVIARDAGVPWAPLVNETDVADSTLSHRAQRIREVDPR